MNKMYIRSHIYYLFLILLLLVLCCSACNKSAEKTQNNSDSQEMVTLLISEEDGIPQEAYDADCKILEERIQQFVHGEEYKLERDGRIIQFTFPEKLLLYAEAISVADNFLTINRRYSLVWGEGAYHAILLPEDYESIEIEKTGESKADFSIKVRFSDKIQERIDRLKDVEKELYLEVPDRMLIESYHLEETENHYYSIKYNEMNWLYGNEDLFVYNLTHPYLTGRYKCYRQYPVNWEEDQSIFGEYQCKISDFSKDSVYLQYSSDLYNPKEMIDKTEHVLKTILDRMQIPYALGISEHAIGIQMEKNPLTKVDTECIIDGSLLGNNFFTRCEYYEGNTGGGELFIEWNKEKQLYEVTLSSREAHSLDRYNQKTKRPICIAAIYPDNIVAVLDENQSVTDDILRFLPKGMSEEKKRYLDNPYLENIENIENIDVYHRYDFCVGHGKVDADELYASNPLVQQVTEDIEQMITLMYPDAKIIQDEGLVYVYLNMDPDENLPQTILESTKKMMSIMTPKILVNHNFLIYPFKQNENDYCKVDLSKLWAEDAIQFVLYGNTFDGYYEEFKNALNEDMDNHSELEKYWIGIQN